MVRNQTQVRLAINRRDIASMDKGKEQTCHQASNPPSKEASAISYSASFPVKD